MPDPRSPSSEITAFLRFVSIAEALKRELRHSWLSDGRHESVAEHSWMMSLLVLMLGRRLATPVDIDRTLRMVIVHDLVEAVCGDVPSFEQGERMTSKAANERAAMDRLRRELPDDIGNEIAELWNEFEARATPEARFAVAVDKLEVQLQHNLAPLHTWLPLECGLVYTKVVQPCMHDEFLASVARAVIEQAERKMADGGIDVAALRAAHGDPAATR